MKQDIKNIHEAIQQNDAERPPMPADLNARLMQRVEKEVNSKPVVSHHRTFWPWIAAACVAGVVMMFLMPPKQDIIDIEEVKTAKVDVPTEHQQVEPVEDVKSQQITANIEPEIKAEPKVHTTKVVTIDEQLAKVEVLQENVDVAEQEVAVIEETPTAEPQPRMLTERDIPITRPENYKYTKEEIALMKKQANEAYLKWVELELEISKYNLENTAENR